MSRVVKKKVIDENIEFSDNFDEDMLDRIEDELSRSMSDEQKAAAARQAAGDRGFDSGFGSEEGAPNGELPLTKAQAQTAGEGAPRETSGAGTDATPQTKLPIYRKIAVKRWVALGSLMLLLVLLSAFLWVWTQDRNVAVPLIQFVRHPVPVPHLQIESKFLMIANSGTRKDLVEMLVEFEFLNTGSYEKFKDGQSAIQDSCFRFMQSHNPAESSQKNWAKLVQNDLLSHLHEEFPKIHIETVTLTQFNRL